LSGAEQQLEALLASFRDVLRQAIRRIAPPALSANLEDIEQEAVISLWRALAAEREIRFPRSYLYRVAVHATLQAVRRHKARREEPLLPAEETDAEARRAHHEPVDPNPTAEATLLRSEQQERLEAALERLVPNRSLAVKLYLQGLTTAEIGLACGWTEAKARNLAYRGLEDLKRALGEGG
jgi:RNA polymerase sigma-70 factor (ECF subfamily)